MNLISDKKTVGGFKMVLAMIPMKSHGNCACIISGINQCTNYVITFTIYLNMKTHVLACIISHTLSVTLAYGSSGGSPPIKCGAE